jgi:alanine racemase
MYIGRPTRALINLSNLRNNLAVARSYISDKTKIMAMVKANAYGHGILEISRELIKNGVTYLGVAYIEEAVFLRENGISTPILVTGAINAEQIPLFIKYDVDITSASIDKSKLISEAATKLNKTAKVHLKIDTGMERIGVHWYHAQDFIEETMALPNLKINGIFSHFASAEDDKEFTKVQIQRFDEVIAFMKHKNILPPFIHLANSAGAIFYPQAQYNMVRLGIILYGYMDKIQEKLKPVMSLKSKVSFFKVVPPNTGIGYTHSYVTENQTRIVTLPLGYADGYSRFFSNKGEVIIRGQRYPVVGNVAMDQIMVDIGQEGTAYNGDDVLVFGEDGADKLSLGELAQKIGTIPYEILCGISSRVPRIYID